MNLNRFFKNHKPNLGGLEILKYIGPGFLVTVGFIDPGNWASNVAAGSGYGYKLLWMVTLSTIMLIFLQHNAAHLGIVTGLCLSEASTKFYRGWVSKLFLSTAVLASISTALAEILGAAIGLEMLFKMPIPIGAILAASASMYMLFSNSYKKLEKWIITFVGIIGFSFVFELALVKTSWAQAVNGWFVPSFPQGSTLIIMSVLGAVVMPHNLFLHSEIIQSRQWNLKSEEIIKRQLKYEFSDTLLSMAVGWAINSAMIIVAAAVFFKNGIIVTKLTQAQTTLKPLLGNAAAATFALALIFAGLSSSITAAMASGTIFAGMFGEPFDIKDNHSRVGAFIAIFFATFIIFFLRNPFKGLIVSQVMLSVQLPWTILGQIILTSSVKVMGKYRNNRLETIILWVIFAIVSILNILLLFNIGKS